AKSSLRLVQARPPRCCNGTWLYQAVKVCPSGDISDMSASTAQKSQDETPTLLPASAALTAIRPRSSATPFGLPVDPDVRIITSPGGAVADAADKRSICQSLVSFQRTDAAAPVSSIRA